MALGHDGGGHRRAATRHRPGWGDAAAVLVLLAFAHWRWQQTGPTVSGLDAGNWLAFGRGLLGDGKATAGVYPPLAPALIASLRGLLGPYDAAKLVAVGSLLAIAVAVYAVVRREARWWAALVAALVAVGVGPVLETWAFGGYPQNLATALLVLLVAAIARYLYHDGRGVGGAALTAALLPLTHHLYAVAAVAALPVVIAVWLSTRPGGARLRQRAPGLALIMGAGVATGAPVALALRAAGFSPAGLGGRAAEEPTRTATAVLLGLMAVGVVALALTHERRRTVLWTTAAALIAPALALALLAGQPRLAPLAAVGAALMIGLALHEAGAWATARGQPRLAPLVALALLALQAPAASDRAAAYQRAYQVLDPPFVEALAWLAARPAAGATAVTADARGWPIGWWVEGVVGGPTLVGGDRRYLAYPAERAHAAAVAALVQESPSAPEAARWATTHGVSRLLLDKAGWDGWRRWDVEPDARVTVLFENERFVVVVFSAE